ncbi:MAG: DUF177 domain-containing protein [Lachnospiraceae bacterium]|nr:DUF177 domain-containing protein [Lachnospiraceae bacterium]
MRKNLELDLFDIFTSEGKVITEKYDSDPEEFSVAGTSYAVKDAKPVTLRIENIALNKVYLTGSCAFTLIMQCDRCLKDTEVPFSLSFERELLSKELRDEAEEPEECGYLEENLLDVYGLIEEELLLSLPEKVLCRKDCKGLCPVCGANRNEKECGCDTFVPDPRLAGLGDILKQLNKEV